MSICTSGGGVPRNVTRPLMLLEVVVAAAINSLGGMTSVTATAATGRRSAANGSGGITTGCATNFGGAAFATATLVALQTGRAKVCGAGCGTGATDASDSSTV